MYHFLKEKMPQINEIRSGQEIGKQPYQKYIWSNCVDCGVEQWVIINYGKPKTERCLSCSHGTPEHRQLKRERLLGDKSHFWKSGRYKDRKDGYIRIKLSPSDFFYSMAPPSDHYVMQHRLVMATFLRRALHPWEIVHHKNGIRDDNRIENLFLVMRDSHDTKTKEHKRIKVLEARIRELEQQLKKQS